MSLSARIAAALVALTAWIGIAIQFRASFGLAGSLGATLWTLFWYFTITTNLLVAIFFTGVAAGSRRFGGPSLAGSVTVSILLVGVTYGLLLHGLIELSGGSAVANVLLHMVTPILVPIFWLVFTAKGGLTGRDPLRWAVYPLAYLFYALVRGEFTGRYPYPFIDVATLGWVRSLMNALLIAIGFVAASWLFVWLDWWLAHRSSSATSSPPTR